MWKSQSLENPGLYFKSLCDCAFNMLRVQYFQSDVWMAIGEHATFKVDVGLLAVNSNIHWLDGSTERNFNLLRAHDK